MTDWRQVWPTGGRYDRLEAGMEDWRQVWPTGGRYGRLKAGMVTAVVRGINSI